MADAGTAVAPGAQEAGIPTDSSVTAGGNGAEHAPARRRSSGAAGNLAGDAAASSGDAAQQAGSRASSRKRKSSKTSRNSDKTGASSAHESVPETSENNGTGAEAGDRDRSQRSSSKGSRRSKNSGSGAPAIAVQASDGTTTLVAEAGVGSEPAPAPITKSRSAPTVLVPQINVLAPGEPARKSPHGKFEHRQSSMTNMMLLDDATDPEQVAAAAAAVSATTAVPEASEPAAAASASASASEPSARSRSRSSKHSKRSGQSKDKKLPLSSEDKMASAAEFFKNSQVLIDRSATSDLLDEDEQHQAHHAHRSGASSGNLDADAADPYVRPQLAGRDDGHSDTHHAERASTRMIRKSWDFSAVTAVGPESQLVMSSDEPAAAAAGDEDIDVSGAVEDRGGHRNPVASPTHREHLDEEEFDPHRGVLSSCTSFFTLNCCVQ